MLVKDAIAHIDDDEWRVCTANTAEELSLIKWRDVGDRRLKKGDGRWFSTFHLDEQDALCGEIAVAIFSPYKSIMIIFPRVAFVNGGTQTTFIPLEINTDFLSTVMTQHIKILKEREYDPYSSMVGNHLWGLSMHHFMDDNHRYDPMEGFVYPEPIFHRYRDLKAKVVIAFKEAISDQEARDLFWRYLHSGDNPTLEEKIEYTWIELQLLLQNSNRKARKSKLQKQIKQKLDEL